MEKEEEIAMIRNVLTASVAVAALTIATPALAKPGEGGAAGANANVNAGANAGANVGASQSAIDARVNSQGSLNASPNAVTHANPNSAIQSNTIPTTPALNGQGLQNANPRAISRANASSALARNAVPSVSLPGLTTGLTVNTSGGATLGTVSQVVTDSSGNIRLVIVTNTTTGQTYRLAPTTLSISGGVVTTTSL
jgi:hypothetical protein